MELRVVEVAINGEVDLNLAVAIFEQGQRELDGELGGIGTFDFFTERELVEDDEIRGFELTLCDLVIHLDTEVAAVQAVAEKLAGIRTGRAEVHVAETGGNFRG